MKKNNRSILAWCLYDVGNSAFATTVMAVIFPIYFQRVAASTLPQSSATAYWGYASSLGLLAGAILAPFLGTFADLHSARKRILASFTVIGSCSAIAMGALGYGDWKWAMVLLISGSVGFSGSAICYDSLLPHLVPIERMDEISTKGYAMGYLGGGTLLALNLWTMALLPGTLGARISFVSVGIWWLAFTLPLIIAVPEPYVGQRGRTSILGTFRTLRKTFHEIREYRDAFVFLMAFWLYNDGIGTVIRMSAIFGAHVGIDEKSLVMALLATQFIGIPFSVLFGIIAKRIGSKRTLYGALSWYLLIAVGAYRMTSALHFWILAISVGVVQGGAQAISRSLYASMLPPDRSAEFFGFYDISSKFAGIIGPAMFGVITQLTGSPRIAVLAVGSTFIVGLFILSLVDVDRGRQRGIMNRSYL